jgi:hypothetical protein
LKSHGNPVGYGWFMQIPRSWQYWQYLVGGLNPSEKY